LALLKALVSAAKARRALNIRKVVAVSG